MILQLRVAAWGGCRKLAPARFAIITIDHKPAFRGVIMPKQIVLIRHGETLWTLTGQHTGRTDLPLTENGESRASRLRTLLQGARFDHVFASPLKRARRTCELAGFGSVAQIEPDLQEWDYGDYEGRTTPEICLGQPGWNVFLDGCPGGESVAQVSRRADRLLAGLGRLNGNIALFSHGQFLRVVAVRWIGLPASEGQHLALDTASISMLGFESHNASIPAICLWNSASDAASGLSPSPGPSTDGSPLRK